jgi:hypothetical protein
MAGDARTAAAIVAIISFALILMVGLASLIRRIVFSNGVLPDAVSVVLEVLISAYSVLGKTAQAHEIVLAGIVFTAI